MEIREEICLKDYSTFRCGGNAAYFAEPATIAEIMEALSFAEKNELKVFVLGGGSNLLISSKGFDGLVIRIGKWLSDVNIRELSTEECEVTCGAGCPMPTFGKKCLDNSLTGAEALSGIPGTIGGAVYMNAGAYGTEIKDIIREVTYVDSKGIHTLSKEELCLSYRESIFTRMKGDFVIVKASFGLKKGNAIKIRQYMEELREKRADSQPLDVPSAGSTFRRPEGNYAGKLIEDSGLRGFCLDHSGAQVSAKHAGFVVNVGGRASAEDVYRLIKHIEATVKEKFGVKLQMEIKLVGEF